MSEYVFDFLQFTDSDGDVALHVFFYIAFVFKEEFEDTRGAIRIHKSKKNRQHNGQKKKDKV
jgi:hypothetical protein